MVFSSSSSPLLNNTAKWCQFETNCFKNNFHYAKYFDTKKEGTTFTKFLKYTLQQKYHHSGYFIYNSKTCVFSM